MMFVQCCCVLHTVVVYWTLCTLFLYTVHCVLYIVVVMYCSLCTLFLCTVHCCYVLFTVYTVVVYCTLCKLLLCTVLCVHCVQCWRVTVFGTPTPTRRSSTGSESPSRAGEGLNNKTTWGRGGGHLRIRTELVSSELLRALIFSQTWSLTNQKFIKTCFVEDTFLLNIEYYCKDYTEFAGKV